MSDSFAFRLAETGAQVKPKPSAPTTIFLHSFKTPNPAPFPPRPSKTRARTAAELKRRAAENAFKPRA
jgi:hypothetical protein